MSTKNSNDSLDRILYKSNAKLALDENFSVANSCIKNLSKTKTKMSNNRDRNHVWVKLYDSFVFA